MSKFINLTNLIININYIHSIVIKPNKYYIHVMSNKFNGSRWSIHGFGIVHSPLYNSSAIEVCKIEHSTDYKIVSDWISKNE
jgi:hypothetical protein